MRRFMLPAVLALCALTVTSVPAEEDGWVSLFNGKDLSGWTQKGGKALYKVENGEIVGSSVPNTDNSFLCTERDFGDFELEFEFFGHPSLNSGVQVRSQSLPDYKDGRVHGYQCELEDEGQDRDWFGGIYDEGRRGWLQPTKEDKQAGAAFSEAGKRLWKNGEWNHIRIEAKGTRIRTYLNGELRADLADGMTPSGFIGLQVHGVGKKTTPMSVRWRNLRIRELKN